MVTLREGWDTETIDSLFLVVPCNNVYNGIISRPFTVTLDAMESLVHLKLNYRNVHDETVMISTNLFGVKRIYKSL